MATTYKGTNKLIVGIVFGVITFWLFAQSMVNIVPDVQADLGISPSLLSIAISLTALFSGIFIVVAGGLADKFGRMKLTYIGLILSIIGSLLLVITQGATLLIIGRIIQGLSAACIMPATLALMKTYFDGQIDKEHLVIGRLVHGAVQEFVLSPVVPLLLTWAGAGFSFSLSRLHF